MQYLVESNPHFQRPKETFLGMLRTAGFGQCENIGTCPLGIAGAFILVGGKISQCGNLHNIWSV